ncbi:hypothetical protein [Cryptosporangium arvum]|uniref:Uncharacterized protein n=1 Tax=Cryptosporangium arvum DSM 44712 TaxID=927661 RepID=A0A010ZS42_9ACTN|nr:hypothetical protein [Cryptosporangium arvum]EXG80037.1 hypothetical protein CryarDRAFT_1096 [Cryptosporangium arvum DSM 44712]
MSIIHEIPTQRHETTPPAPSARPHWLRTPCPAWCEWEHRDGDRRGDRQHMAFAGRIELALYDPAEAADDTYQPETLGVALDQHVDNAEPVVILYRENDEVRLTLAEAEQLRGRLDWALAVTR